MKECDSTVLNDNVDLVISIHALYERVRRSDRIDQSPPVDFNPRTLWKSATTDVMQTWRFEIISIHALYERVRQKHLKNMASSRIFQSTHSMKECDLEWRLRKSIYLNFNPRTLWKSATFCHVTDNIFIVISIHALYERVRHCLFESYW